MICIIKYLMGVRENILIRYRQEGGSCILETDIQAVQKVGIERVTASSQVH